VREDFRATCAYCPLEEIWAAGVENFEVDHFRPQALFPELRASYYNLYLRPLEMRAMANAIYAGWRIPLIATLCC